MINLPRTKRIERETNENITDEEGGKVPADNTENPNDTVSEYGR
jgi:hypothetical protein